MPVYEARCQTCSELTEYIRCVADRDNVPECKHCGKDTRKIISLSNPHPDFQPYYDDNLQTGIQSRQHRNKVMKEQGVMESFGKGWT